MKDYLLDLLNNRKRYEAQISVLKNHQCMFNDPDEFDRYMQIEKDLKRLDFCIELLEPQHREIIEQLYSRGLSMKQLGRTKLLSKGGIQNRKTVALRELSAIFRVKP